MKILQRVVPLVIGFLFLSYPVRSETIIDPDIKNQIINILNAPIKIFQLDLKENTRYFNNIDKWFNKRIKFDNVYSQHKKDKRITIKMKLSENIQILADGKTLKGAPAKETFYAWYIREPQRRIFLKELQVPSKQYLPEDDVIQIARNFITNNTFCKITQNDKLCSAVVMSRKRHELKPSITEEDILILFHRVEFKREFFGMEVFNSKQVVYIHPDTREILSYKNIMWTPTDEATGESKSYLKAEDVLAKVKEAFAKSEDEYKVVKVKAGMYQTGKIVFPVLKVNIKRKLHKSEAIPIQEVLIINLIEGLDLKLEKKGIRLPIKTKK